MSRFKIQKNIIKNKELLVIGHIPESLDDILHRDTEIDLLTMHFSSYFDGSTPNNLFMYGPTGSGKTLMAKLTINELQKDALADGLKIFSSYINCSDTITNMAVMSNLVKSAISFINPEEEKLRLSYNEYFHYFIKIINSNDCTCIIILDEIDKLQDPNELLYQLCRIKENEYSTKNICIIGISNDLHFKDKLDSRTISSLCETELTIVAYNRDEIFDIVTNRASKALFDNAYDNAILDLIAARSAQQHGDARRALDLLRVSAEIAENNRSLKITDINIKEAEFIINNNKEKISIASLPGQQKIVLLSCMYHFAEQHKHEIESSVAHSTYKSFCKVLDKDAVTKRSFTNYIKELDMYGILEIEKTSRGKSKGVTNIIKSAANISPYEIVAILFDDIMLTSLESQFTRNTSLYNDAKKKFQQMTLFDNKSSL